MSGDTSQESWLTLMLAPELGPAASRALLDRFGSVDSILGASGSALTSTGLSAATINALQSPNRGRLSAAQRWLEEDNHYLLHWQDPRYPPLLMEIDDSPAVLFVAGDPDILGLPQLAIVGSRHATQAGSANAREFAAHLAGAGLVITSGLAAGIDSAAHMGALDAAGRTIAVLGTGPDIAYPAANRALAERISSTGGALVSEFPPGVPVRRDHFPRRNRIISGLSLGVLVVEAGMRSGSLITARLSGNYGREVFAVPGSIHSPLSKGCHRLIKQGAKLVENSADIIEELASLAGVAADASAAAVTPPDSPAHNDPAYAELLRSMAFEPADLQTLVDRSGLTAGELSSMLLILELEGMVETLPGGRFQQLTGWNKSHE